MLISADIESFGDQLNALTSDYKLFYDSLRKLKGGNVQSSLIQKSEEYLKNGNSRLERIKSAYDGFSSQINQICENYVSEVNKIEKEEINEVEGLRNDFEKMKNELMNKNEELNSRSLYNEREPLFVYRENSISKMDVDLVKRYPGSYVYREYMNGERTTDGNVFIDIDGTNDELIVKYMNDDESLIDDLKKLNTKKRGKLIDDMSFLELPIKKDIIKEIGRNEDNEMMEAWRERRVVMVNGRNVNGFKKLLKSYKLFDSLFNNEYLKNIHYYKPNNTFYIDVKMKYCDVIEDYLKNGKKINEELVKRYYYDNGNEDELMNEMKMIGIELNEEEKEEIRGCFDPRLLRGSTILLDTQYDSYLKNWVGDCKWKLLYRASEHGYTAESFHQYCDDKGPTLIVIKSSGGWIFGGYTTRSWSGDGIYYDMI